MGSHKSEFQSLIEDNARLRARVKELEAQQTRSETSASLPDFAAMQLGLQYSQAQMASILESMPSAVVIIAADSGRLIYINRRAHELYGTDFVGSELTEHAQLVRALQSDGSPYPAEDLPANRSIRNGELVQNAELIMQQPTGKQLTVLVSSAPLYDTEGKIIAAVASFHDISERKQAEDALQAALGTAEVRTHELEAVVNSVPDGLAVFGLERRIIFLNEAGRQNVSKFMTVPDPTTGKSELNAYDITGRRILPDEEVESRVFTHGVTIHDEIFSTQPDHEPVTWITMSGAPIRDDHDTVIGAVVLSRDITEHRKFENTIAFQSHLLESVQDSIIATDAEFHITYWNQAAEILLGWTAEQVLGRRVSEFLNPVFPEKNLDEAIEKLYRNDAYAAEVIFHHKDGTPINLENRVRLIRDAEGGIKETITIMRDIRERKRAEFALQESEQKYRDLVRHAPIGIFEVDFATRKFISVNECMVAMTGYSREDLLTMGVLDLHSDDSKEIAYERIRQIERGETPDPEVDYTWITKDRRRISVALMVNTTRNAQGRLVSAGIAHNVTERKQLEMALKRQSEELMIADRNKNQFLSILSHELRNPLAVITASADLLAHFKADEERTKRAVRVLQRQSGHLAHLVDDLLDVTRITTGKLKLKKELVDVISLVYRTVLDAQPQYAAKCVTLSASLPGHPIVLEADPVRLTQAVGNLLDNALKFTPAEGHVTVTVSLDRLSNSKMDAGTDVRDASDSEVRITITDTGAGIAPDMLPRLFEPFSQAEQPLARTQGGLGLGLSIVKGMVELHGGRVEAESGGDGKGATFTIRLPIG